jgi:prophage DNA circulation protein
VHEQFGKMRVKLDEKRDDHDAAVAERRAQRTELNAEDAVSFAIFAVDEAEAAVLEAIDARVVADALA